MGQVTAVNSNATLQMVIEYYFQYDSPCGITFNRTEVRWSAIRGPKCLPGILLA